MSVQNIHVTPNLPLAGVISLQFQTSHGHTFDITLANSDAEGMVAAIRGALETAPHGNNPPESLGKNAAQRFSVAVAGSEPGGMAARNSLQNFAVNAEPGREWISLRFEMANAGLIDMALPISIIELLFEAIGKGLTLAKSELTGTRQ
jgi:hypothetical protein